MTSAQFREQLDLAKQQGTGLILIAAHCRPDGDAVSSAVSTAGILQDAGYHALALLPDPVPDSCLAFLPGDLVVTGREGLKPSLFIAVDCSNRERIAADGFEPDCPMINIDHHPDNSITADLSLVRPECCAAAEVLYHLFTDCGFRISPENATRLLLGILTDSGCFRFDNTTPSALDAAAALLRLGADRHKIVLESFQNRDKSLVCLEADLLNNGLRMKFDGRLAWFVLTKELLQKHGVDVRNTETLIDAVRNIRGVEFAALLREESGGFKLSLRTKNAPWSAGKVARRLNGGGHEMAAGGFIPANSIEEAEQILAEQIQMELNGL
jgi:phosphoesterase RecJ-like protein